MALIICQECGKEISDKSKACIHCGCPIEFATPIVENRVQDVVEIREVEVKNEESSQENGCCLEIINCGDSKMKMAELLSSEFKAKFRDVMDKLNELPCRFENVEKRIFNVLIEEIEDSKVEYNLYEDNELIKSKAQTEVVVDDKSDENLNIESDESPSEESEFNVVKYFATIGFLFFLMCLLSIAVKYSEDKKDKENAEYYNSLETIINVEDFYMLDRNDVQAIYGDPNKGKDFETGDLDSDIWYYYEGEYTLKFLFVYGRVDTITYLPNTPFVYKNGMEDVFYLFGLSDEINVHNIGEYNYVKYYDGWYFVNGSIDKIIPKNVDEDNKTIEYIEIELNNELPERRVPEYDFSNIEEVHDLVQYLSWSYEDVYIAFGEGNNKQDDFPLVYDTEQGKLRFYIYNDLFVSSVSFESYEPINYITSTQESMVMFGVDQNLTSMHLEDIDEYVGSEKYEGDEVGISIEGINYENKTFKYIHMNNR